MSKLKCGCTITKEGYTEKECKYHKEHCHSSGCKKKLKKYKDERPNENYYCKKHDDIMDGEWKGLVDAFGGSDYDY